MWSRALRVARTLCSGGPYAGRGTDISPLLRSIEIERIGGGGSIGPRVLAGGTRELEEGLQRRRPMRPGALVNMEEP